MLIYSSFHLSKLNLREHRHPPEGRDQVKEQWVIEVAFEGWEKVGQEKEENKKEVQHDEEKEGEDDGEEEEEEEEEGYTSKNYKH